MQGRASGRKLEEGVGDAGLPPYLLLYLAQLGWFAVGLWLYRVSQWPSTCMPGNVIELYACSSRLPESGRWLDGAMLTWLWVTPMLIVLELGRRLSGKEE